jgi:hypothetical protein
VWKRIKGGLTYDKRTRSIKRFKKVTLEELDEAIKAVDKQEQEEAIEYFKKHIKYFENKAKELLNK